MNFVWLYQVLQGTSLGNCVPWEDSLSAAITQNVIFVCAKINGLRAAYKWANSSTEKRFQRSKDNFTSGCEIRIQSYETCVAAHLY